MINHNNQAAQQQDPTAHLTARQRVELAGYSARKIIEYYNYSRQAFPGALDFLASYRDKARKLAADYLQEHGSSPFAQERDLHVCRQFMALSA